MEANYYLGGKVVYNKQSWDTIYEAQWPKCQQLFNYNIILSYNKLYVSKCHYSTTRVYQAYYINIDLGVQVT